MVTGLSASAKSISVLSLKFLGVRKWAQEGLQICDLRIWTLIPVLSLTSPFPSADGHWCCGPHNWCLSVDHHATDDPTVREAASSWFLWHLWPSLVMVPEETRYSYNLLLIRLLKGMLSLLLAAMCCRGRKNIWYLLRREEIPIAGHIGSGTGKTLPLCCWSERVVRNWGTGCTTSWISLVKLGHSFYLWMLYNWAYKMLVSSVLLCTTVASQLQLWEPIGCHGGGDRLQCPL